MHAAIELMERRNDDPAPQSLYNEMIEKFKYVYKSSEDDFETTDSEEYRYSDSEEESEDDTEEQSFEESTKKSAVIETKGEQESTPSEEKLNVTSSVDQDNETLQKDQKIVTGEQYSISKRVQNDHMNEKTKGSATPHRFEG